MRKKAADDPRQDRLLRRLRRICLRLPAAEEKVSWGNPTFVAGRRAFAVLDRYEGRWVLAFRAPPARLGALLARGDCFAAPYSARHGWVCLDAGGKLDWREVEELVVDSYRQVALKWMLAMLERGRG